MTGRYDRSPRRTFTAPDGTVVTYLEPRVLPFGWQVASAQTTAVAGNERDRLDLVANRALGDPLLAWRIADANDAMDPFDLCDEPGRVLQLPDSGL